MKLNIITKNPDKILEVLQDLFPHVQITHSKVSDDIHDFELVKDGDTVVFPLEALNELCYYGIRDYNIRIY